MFGKSDKEVKTIQEDAFGLDKYVNGLKNYILECDTPTTIAVQGDWGSGKTSMLNMVKEKLGEDVKPIWFNTWQYSKFNMDNMLAVSLLTHLFKALSKDSGVVLKTNVKTALITLGKVGARVGSYVAGFFGVEKLADDMNEVASAQESDIFSIIENLKEEFQNTINEIYKKTGGKRVVVFIDDLDRLEPSKAVDLMEVLKLFLDCENCVYVLAIDYGVVTRGISDKYGEDFGKKQGRKFFDKIIQVPFFIPVEKYEIKKYLMNSMKDRVRLQDEDVDKYISMIKYSVGYNPRSMKRLFNAYLLISMIYDDKNFSDDPIAQKILFATLCMQLSMEDIYNYIVERLEDLDEQFFLRFLEEDTEYGMNDYFPDIKLTEEYNTENIIQFMREFVGILTSSNDNIPKDSYNKLTDVFKISSSTSTVTVRTRKGTAVLEDDIVVEKKLGLTDVKYKIICASSKLHIGFGEKIKFTYKGKDYSANMHKTSKGRIDALGEFYKDVSPKEGDVFRLTYKYNEKRIICEPVEET